LFLWDSLPSLLFFSSSSSCCLTNICILHDAMNILTSLARRIPLQTNIIAFTKSDANTALETHCSWEIKLRKNFYVHETALNFCLYNLHTNNTLRYKALMHSFSPPKHILCVLSSGIARHRCHNISYFLAYKAHFFPRKMWPKFELRLIHRG
jgi:hypothetical protein